MSTYTALLEQTAAQQYRITFPDFAGLTCTAVSQELVRSLAEAVLASQLAELRSQGIAAPEPCSFKDATAERAHCIALLITMDSDSDTERFKVSLHPALQTAA